MGVYEVPAIVADKVSPRARELLQKVPFILLQRRRRKDTTNFIRSMISSRMNASTSSARLWRSNL